LLSPFLKLPEINVVENADPLDSRSRQHEEMPYKMSRTSLHSEGYDTKGIYNTAADYISEKSHSLTEKLGDKHKSAPAKRKIKRIMKPFQLRGSENGNKGNAGNDDHPLDNKENVSLDAAHVRQKYRCKGCAYQKIDGKIVKSSEYALHGAAVRECMVKRAHGKEKKQPKKIHYGSHALHCVTGIEQHEYKCRNRQSGSHGMGDEIPYLLKERSLRRINGRLFPKPDEGCPQCLKIALKSALRLCF
jgi:hypothetical protein